MPAIPDFGRKRVLEGTLVMLVPIARDHLPELMPLLSDPEVGRLTGTVHSSHDNDQLPWTRAELAEIYARWSVAEDRIVWAIIENSTGRVVGESVLNDLDAGNRSCGFRIWISGARDKGLGTEATRLTLQHAFADQGLNRVSLEVYDFNPRARRVYEKVGFRHEGTLREALLFDGSWIDAHVMSILAREWSSNEPI